MRRCICPQGWVWFVCWLEGVFFHRSSVCVCVCVVQVCKGQCSRGVAPAGGAGRDVCIGRGAALTPGCVQVGVQAHGCLCEWEEELRVSLPPVMVTGCGCTWAGGVAAAGCVGTPGVTGSAGVCRWAWWLWGWDVVFLGVP